YAVLPYDQPELHQAFKQVRAKKYFFSKQQTVHPGAFVRGETIVFADEQGLEEEMMTLPELAVPHVDNALAAILITKLAGANTAAIKQVLSTFGGVEHRMEYVATVNGVKYFNDSKATNPEAASRALQAFSEPVVLIAGGLDRGVDFHELVPFIRKHVKALIAYGQTAQILLERAKEAGISERILVDTVDKAVITAASIAQEGDVVLLSPACASWDMFPSFEVRGSMFKDGVH
ncbi:hypothetical protein MXD63_36900, partial [Frankia sp. Cpl3]|nr:hypothetical protein [Frankia sp. Cpl3]